MSKNRPLEEKHPDDTEAWIEEVRTVKKLPPVEEKPQTPLIIDEIRPSLTQEGVYNQNSFKKLELGNTGYLDAKTADRFRKGAFEIEARLDLHGRGEKEAFELVKDFILTSYLKGKRCLLIITGKGLKHDEKAWYEKTGILKEALPNFLNHPDVRPFVLSFVSARQEDGGSGAIYVLLKRHRKITKV